ncbi:ABC transporter permease [Clostridium tertium]|jgi:peptide/nickel transport system permease protein|uniref:ABC transporter permease n=1 Tax=Clostridium TaxID=1485 RepID=UPI00115746AE|nr:MULTISPECIES: ABC transporter permease [Clostridium]MBS5305551.1 ABC transporter permease [Clostridium sp.]MDB1922671.1 ABC transporter permease [Clostridium tertium]MDB1925736.1 ABC transporter permease [Clostridium tertium]MDB1929027.1 ABC transporter permease [Clostridium tertium]MDB1932836.1 ABC transporter permease [Clostridium tertium]
MSNTVAVKQKNKTINKEGSFLNSLKEFFEVIWDNKMARIGFIILVIFLLMAIFGPMFVSDPKSDYLARLKAPSAKHWLGTDYAGRDILSLFIFGSRSVLLVAFYAAVFSIIFACGIGISAGLLGGKTDNILMLITDIVLTMPTLPVTMVLSMVINVSNNILFGLVLSLWSWAGLAKAIRSQVLVIRNKDFIEASKVMGISTINIIIKDVVPNIISFIAINFISIMKGAIMTSVSLMVLGLVPFQGSHWGMMIQMAMSQSAVLYGGIGPIVYFLTPIMGIVLFQLGCYFFANGLDEAMNPRLRKQ